MAIEGVSDTPHDYQSSDPTVPHARKEAAKPFSLNTKNDSAPANNEAVAKSEESEKEEFEKAWIKMYANDMIKEQEKNEDKRKKRAKELDSQG